MNETLIVLKIWLNNIEEDFHIRYNENITQIDSTQCDKYHQHHGETCQCYVKGRDFTSTEVQLIR